MDERVTRLRLAAEPKAIGYGGVATVAKATGVGREAVVALVRSTKTEPGLRGRGKLDPRRHEVRNDVPVDGLKRVHIKQDVFHGEWNYAVRAEKTAR